MPLDSPIHNLRGTPQFNPAETCSRFQAVCNKSKGTAMKSGLQTIHRVSVIAGLCLLCFGLFPISAFADYNYPFPDAPLQFPPLPQTAVGPTVPSSPGWIVARVNSRPNVYWVTDGNYQSMFIVTSNGVIVVDAPEPLPFYPPLPVMDAVRSITPLPITHMIYSHAHTDHIGGRVRLRRHFPRSKSSLKTRRNGFWRARMTRAVRYRHGRSKTMRS